MNGSPMRHTDMIKVVEKVKDMQQIADDLRSHSKAIGFVPTMGFLHEGHLSLMRCARSENDIVVVSIYVNPTQFGEGEDFGSYPRDIERDINLLQKEHVDFLFLPSDGEMYPQEPITKVGVYKLGEHLCGARRKGHFDGVCLVVSKLFNIVKPHRAYFGKKDYQQYRIVERMTKDLNFDIDIMGCPIVREKDGLAMSSRNTYLNERERSQAVCLYDALKLAQRLIQNGERNSKEIVKNMESYLSGVESVKSIDYIEIVDKYSLTPVERIKGDELIALAVFIGKARLIDNMEVFI